MHPTTVSVALPQLTAGVYRVRWTTLSAADLHTTSGVVVFGVQRAVIGRAGRHRRRPATPGGGRAALARPPRGRRGRRSPVGRSPRRRPASTARVRAPSRAPRGAGRRQRASVAGAALLAVQAALSGAGIGAVALRLRLRLAVGAAGGRRAARSPRPLCSRCGVGCPVPRTIAGVLLAGYAAGTAAVGHAGAVGLTDPLRFVADVVHVGRRTVLGRVSSSASAVLAAGSRRAPRVAPAGAGHRPAGRRGASRSSWSPACCWPPRRSSPSTRCSSPRTGGCCSARSRSRLSAGWSLSVPCWPCGPRTPLVPRRLRATWPARSGGGRACACWSSLEAAVLVGVVVAAAGVASARPASGTEWIPASEAVPLRSGQARDLVETLKLSPNRPGRNFVSVDVFSQYLPPPGPITSVTVVLTRPGAQPVSVPMTQDSPQATAQASPVGGPQAPWVGVTDGVDRPGSWTATVVVTREDVETATRELPVAGGRPQGPAAAADHLLDTLAGPGWTGWQSCSRRSSSSVGGSAAGPYARPVADAELEEPRGPESGPPREPESEAARESMSGSR